MNNQDDRAWKVLDTIAEIKTKWVTIHVNEMLDNNGNKLEYWHYDRADSAIVIVKQGDDYLLPEPIYRPGAGKVTLDFAGGRIASGKTPEQAGKQVAARELNIDQEVFEKFPLQPINTNPWLVDSAFSSQKVHGFFVELPIEVLSGAKRFTFDMLLAKLDCMQCRATLLEWRYGK